jgi:hypothetical protein
MTILVGAQKARVLVELQTVKTVLVGFQVEITVGHSGYLLSRFCLCPETLSDEFNGGNFMTAEHSSCHMVTAGCLQQKSQRRKV